MTRKPSATVRINRAALSAIREGHVAALEEMAQRVLEVAQPHIPDAPPYGEGLVVEGAYAIWSDGRKVAGTARKPRSVRTPGKGVLVVAGYPFPMGFYELGTVHQPSRPTLTPAALSVVPEAVDFVRRNVRRALAKVR